MNAIDCERHSVGQPNGGIPKNTHTVDVAERSSSRSSQRSNVIVNRMLHEPIVRAKESSRAKDGYVYVESLRHLFGLEEARRQLMSVDPQAAFALGFLSEAKALIKK